MGRACELFTVESGRFASTYGDQVFRFTGNGFVPSRVDLFADSDHGRTDADMDGKPSSMGLNEYIRK